MLTHRAEIRRAFLGREVIPPFFSDEWIRVNIFVG